MATRLTEQFCAVPVAQRRTQEAISAMVDVISLTDRVVSEVANFTDNRVALPDNYVLREYLVHLVPHMLTARRLQVPHRTLHIGVTEPLLNCTQIDSCPQ